MRKFIIYKSMLKYLTDKNLSLNAKVLLSIVLFQDEIVGTEIENYVSMIEKQLKMLYLN